MRKYRSKTRRTKTRSSRRRRTGGFNRTVKRRVRRSPGRIGYRF